MRIMTYDRAANERNVVSALRIMTSNDSSTVPLSWFRVDDGVMGGLSETNHEQVDDVLHFQGTINTNGGGFTSIRSKIPQGTLAIYQGVKLRLQGDGKTYKFIMSSGKSAGSPFSSHPSWQYDIPTSTSCDKAGSNDDWHEVVVPFEKLLPSFGPRSVSDEERHKFTFDPSEMQEIGLMLSLKLSNGKPNPTETFGQGIFPFSLRVQSIEPLENAS